MGPHGYVEIVRQYTWDPAQRLPVLKLPKCGKTRNVPIPSKWIKNMLGARLSGKAPVRPRDNVDGLKYVATRYSNVVIAEAVGSTEGAVRKWLGRANVKRKRRVVSGRPTSEHLCDIRDHLLFGQVKRKPQDYLFTDEQGRLPAPDHVEKVFQRLVKQCGLKRIRLHDLRHSFRSIWAERVQPTVLKEMMGHSSITTTERYIHTTDDVFRRSLEEAE